ncbi:unnamed protein product [Triticum turgidum subsp. durum]|uniref:Uncharacterized protein n=1 Tax=Triticum turgidum subsp. durum TaxID=4567 RepID=A0A9R1A6X6_TRITD|nr:unnamed protein product [Triticum turgidum subsp. durum]
MACQSTHTLLSPPPPIPHGVAHPVHSPPRRCQHIWHGEQRDPTGRRRRPHRYPFAEVHIAGPSGFGRDDLRHEVWLDELEGWPPGRQARSSTSAETRRPSP